MQATGKTGYELCLDVSSSFILLTMLLVAGTLSSVMASSSTRVSPDNLLREASQKMLQLQSNPGNLHWRPQKFHAITDDDRRKNLVLREVALNMFYYQVVDQLFMG